jgi:hypothetical protein
MKTSIAPSVTANFQNGKQHDISPARIQRKLEVLEMNLTNAQLSNQVPFHNNLYLDDAKRMLVFARQNYDKGFFYVSDASLLLAKTYIERCKLSA